MKERRTSIQQQTNHSTIASFSATIYPTNTLCTLPPRPLLSYIYPPPLSPTAVPPFPSHPLSKLHPTTLQHHNSAHIIRQNLLISLKFTTTNQEMGHILPYSAITQYTPFITNYSTYLLSSNNPPESVLSLNSNLSHSPDPVSTSHLSTPVPSLPTYTILMCFSYILLVSNPSHFLP